MTTYPRLNQTVLDTTNVRGLAEFYREFLGYNYRPGDEPPIDGSPDDSDWLVLLTAKGEGALAFQHVDQLTPTTWPDAAVPMQMHIDFKVANVDELDHQRSRALELGATLRLDRRDDPDEPVYVFTDPAGHPFCVFVG